MTATGCEYREYKGFPQCNKVCDAGKNMCPHHLLLIQAKAEQRKPPAKAGSKPRPTSTTPRAYQQ